MATATTELSDLSAPSRIEDLGVSKGLVEELFGRRLHALRSSTITEMADALAVSASVAKEIAEALREKALLEYQGMDGRDYRVALTEAGSRQISERMRAGSHTAAMPIPIDHYRQLVNLQKAVVTVDRPRVKSAFSDLVVEDLTLDQIGPAFRGDGAIFLYGPAGTGKTALIERLGNIYEDAVLIPRFVVVDGQLIALYDPSVHEKLDQPPGLDPRYVLCRRPLIMVGGELTLDMVDLQYDSFAGVSIAPIQMQANNGILAIDDFGRQAVSTDEVLNRWIVPLSRGFDFLRPPSGSKFTVPFELKLVVSTNLAPSSLGDEAFLRRLRNKIYIGACTDAAFNWILVRAADSRGLDIDPQAPAYLAQVTKAYLGELRPYVAVDFCDLAADICAYDGLPRVFNPHLIERVAGLCFVKDD